MPAPPLGLAPGVAPWLRDAPGVAAPPPAGVAAGAPRGPNVQPAGAAGAHAATAAATMPPPAATAPPRKRRRLSPVGDRPSPGGSTGAEAPGLRVTAGAWAWSSIMEGWWRRTAGRPSD